MSTGKELGKRTFFYRVRFQGRDDKTPYEVVVERVFSSDYVGLITLEGFVFNDHTKQVILPAEDEARKKFSTVERLHIPYHNILYIEEFVPQAPNLQHLPFIKGIVKETDSTSDESSLI